MRSIKVRPKLWWWLVATAVVAMPLAIVVQVRARRLELARTEVRRVESAARRSYQLREALAELRLGEAQKELREYLSLRPAPAEGSKTDPFGLPFSHLPPAADPFRDGSNAGSELYDLPWEEAVARLQARVAVESDRRDHAHAVREALEKSFDRWKTPVPPSP
jgi:hypothetical protein